MGVAGSGAAEVPATEASRDWTPRFWIALAVAALAQWGAVQVMGRLHGTGPSWSDEYFLSGGADGAFADETRTFTTLGILFAIGLPFGIAQGYRALLLGPATVACYCVVIGIEGALEPTSHRLLPFEIIVYIAIAAPGVLGAGAGAMLRTAWRAFVGQRSRTPPRV